MLLDALTVDTLHGLRIEVVIADWLLVFLNDEVAWMELWKRLLLVHRDRMSI